MIPKKYSYVIRLALNNYVSDLKAARRKDKNKTGYASAIKEAQDAFDYVLQNEQR